MEETPRNCNCTIEQNMWCKRRNILGARVACFSGCFGWRFSGCFGWRFSGCFGWCFGDAIFAGERLNGLTVDGDSTVPCTPAKTQSARIRLIG